MTLDKITFIVENYLFYYTENKFSYKDALYFLKCITDYIIYLSSHRAINLNSILENIDIIINEIELKNEFNITDLEYLFYCIREKYLSIVRIHNNKKSPISFDEFIKPEVRNSKLNLIIE